MADIRYFGIRHHGPGGSRCVIEEIADFHPDALALEMPADLQNIWPYLLLEQTKMPVAVLTYAVEQPERAMYFPLSDFSPEYILLFWAHIYNCSIHLMDLPTGYVLAQDDPDEMRHIYEDPLGDFGRVAGYETGDSWWEAMFEQRHDCHQMFEAIAEAMTAMREAGYQEEPQTYLREAYMRQTLREIVANGAQKIAVVCGAWHTPALQDLNNEMADKALLASLTAVETSATMVPWSNDRLAMRTGYGAGVSAPGWYRHIFFSEPENRTADWMVKVISLLRSHGIEISPAHAIAAAQLADNLAALRDKPYPSLAEMNEAITAVSGGLSPQAQHIIYEDLIIGQQNGTVPPNLPLTPLQEDINKQIKRLRLKLEEDLHVFKIDLRKPLHVEKSQFLHRLILLKIEMASLDDRDSKKGTFTEQWYVRRSPHLVYQIVQCVRYGNTVYEAATNFFLERIEKDLLLDNTHYFVHNLMVCDLPDTIALLISRIQALAAQSKDIIGLMQAFTGLAPMLSYGNVRQTDTELLHKMVDTIVLRALLGVANACLNLSEDAARAMFAAMNGFHTALRPLNNANYEKRWYEALKQIATHSQSHPLLAGQSCRILVERQIFDSEEAQRQLSLQISAALSPEYITDWLEGFLSHSALILIYDEVIFNLIDQWVNRLPEETFISILPTLRRITSKFSATERQQISEKTHTLTAPLPQAETGDYDDRLKIILPILTQYLGDPTRD